MDDVEHAADFWDDALGRAVDPDHPGTRGNYITLETPLHEPIVQIQRVTHESRVHTDAIYLDVRFPLSAHAVP